MSSVSKFELISRLNCIVRPTKKDADEFQQKMEMMIEYVDGAMSEDSNLKQLIGDERNCSLMMDHHRSHALFMENLFYSYDSSALINSMVYMINIFEKNGFAYNFWKKQFKYWVGALEAEMDPESFQRIEYTYNFIGKNFMSLVELSKGLHYHQKIHETTVAS